MITIVITSYNEPNATLRAVQTFLNQKIEDAFRIIVADPFPNVDEFLKKNINKKEHNKIKFFLDPGEGKSYALNIILQEYSTGNKDDIFILTDGDVYVSDNAVLEIARAFADKEVGCVMARPIALHPKANKYQYWSYVAFNAIHKLRHDLSQKRKFFECSGYLFAIRDGIISDFPLETSEDAIIPYLFWKKGYLIRYLPQVEVYVKNPDNWIDYKNQKIRNIKAHENLNNIAPDLPRTKSFINEMKMGFFYALVQPSSLKELYWIIQFYPARLYLYLKALQEIQKNKGYKDGWRETEIKSTKPFD